MTARYRARLALLLLQLGVSLCAFAGPPTPSLDLLRNRAFVELQASFDRLQTDYEADTAGEMAMATAFWEFKRADPELEPLLDEWVQAMPASYAARTARAAYRVETAHAWRGGAWSGDVAPARWDAMNRWLQAADEDIAAAVRSTAKPVFAIETRMRLLSLSGSGEEIKAELDKAVLLDANAMGPRRAYLGALLPRWGGSYQAMRAFGDGFKDAAHAKLRPLPQIAQAAALADQGDLAHSARDYVAAVRFYGEARAVHEDAQALCGLARSYAAIGQTQNAIDLLNRGVALAPLSAFCYATRGQAYLNARQPALGVADLRDAAGLGDVHAAALLGNLYLSGNEGVGIDVAEAVRWLEVAAHFWDTSALFALGKLYERGPGVAIDLRKAAQYYREAADLGYGPAENDLGLALWYGNGVDQDQVEAVRLWRRAAGRGIWQSQHNLEYFLHPVDRYLIQFGFVDGPGHAKEVLGAAGAVLAIMLVLLVAERRQSRIRAKAK
ncbi:MAG TPA: DUF4034 domain-containing protein [Rhodocyclaceae bacterium]